MNAAGRRCIVAADVVCRPPHGRPQKRSRRLLHLSHSDVQWTPGALICGSTLEGQADAYGGRRSYQRREKMSRTQVLTYPGVSFASTVRAQHDDSAILSKPRRDVPALTFYIGQMGRAEQLQWF